MPITSRTPSAARSSSRSAKEPPLKISGDADRYNHRVGNDDYSQPRALFNLFDEGQKERLFSNIAAAMGGVPEDIVERQLAHFDKVHPDYGNGVRRALVGGGRQGAAGDLGDRKDAAGSCRIGRLDPVLEKDRRGTFRACLLFIRKCKLPPMASAAINCGCNFELSIARKGSFQVVGMKICQVIGGIPGGIRFYPAERRGFHVCC